MSFDAFTSRHLSRGPIHEQGCHCVTFHFLNGVDVDCHESRRSNKDDKHATLDFCLTRLQRGKRCAREKARTREIVLSCCSSCQDHQLSVFSSTATTNPRRHHEARQIPHETRQRDRHGRAEEWHSNPRHNNLYAGLPLPSTFDRLHAKPLHPQLWIPR